MTITLGAQFEVDANGGLARVATLTSTTAIALYSSAASGIEARHLTRSGTTLTGGTVLTIDANQAASITICRLSNTTALIGYAYGATHRVRVLSVSGTTLTAEAVTNMTDTGVSYLTCDLLDTNKVIYAYSDSVNDGKAVILTLSGVTITENAIKTFESVATVLSCAVATLDTATAIVGYEGSLDDPYAEILDVSGTTITDNAAYQVNATNVGSVGESQIDVAAPITGGSYFYYTYITSGGGSKVFILINTAGTISEYDNFANDNGDSVSITTVDSISGADPGLDMIFIVVADITTDLALNMRQYDAWNLSTIDTDTSISIPITQQEIQARRFQGVAFAIIVWNESTEAIVVDMSTPVVLSLATMTKPAAIDADGSYIYVALLDSGTPILTKIATSLDADGSTVFDPGSGDQIGVECGRFDADVVWVAGQFNGTNVIELSEDAGSSFSVADNGSIGGIRSFVMGPDSDNRLLVFDEDNGDILETRDGGGTWTTINSSVTPEVYAIGRLGENVEESVFGNQGAASDNVDYSVNSGDDLEDLIFPINQDITGIIVN